MTYTRRVGYSPRTTNRNNNFSGKDDDKVTPEKDNKSSVLLLSPRYTSF